MIDYYPGWRNCETGDLFLGKFCVRSPSHEVVMSVFLPCRDWCSAPCAVLTGGDLSQECGGCNSSLTCNPEAADWRTVKDPQIRVYRLAIAALLVLLCSWQASSRVEKRCQALLITAVWLFLRLSSALYGPKSYAWICIAVRLGLRLAYQRNFVELRRVWLDMTTLPDCGSPFESCCCHVVRLDAYLLRYSGETLGCLLITPCFFAVEVAQSSWSNIASQLAIAMFMSLCLSLCANLSGVPVLLASPVATDARPCRRAAVPKLLCALT